MRLNGMRIKYTPNAASDIAYLKEKDRKVFQRIRRLLDDTVENPFSGIGRPEPLRHNLTGKWSRRITREHRIVYEVIDNAVIVYQCRFHY